MSKMIQSYHISLKKYPASDRATLDKPTPCRYRHAQRLSSLSDHLISIETIIKK
ncbi:hypothetical protein HMPREF1869_00176 [Bacteroidales bacterium KA00251]|nr:hypothetical protein HMPREF1869_00176 [Bacteroidales bacterium KA00251]